MCIMPIRFTLLDVFVTRDLWSESVPVAIKEMTLFYDNTWHGDISHLSTAMITQRNIIWLIGHF